MTRLHAVLVTGFGLSAALALAGSVVAATAPTGQAPTPGRYEVRMCVQSLVDEARPANCGPAELWMQRGQRAQLRVSDLNYRLRLHSSQVDVVLMHGAVQIDEFTANYDWRGTTLHFTDRDQRLHYSIELGARAATGPR